MQYKAQTILKYSSIAMLAGGILMAAYIFFLKDDQPNTIGFADNQIVVTDDFVERGQAIYSTHCASCHGINGEGQVPAAPLQPDETGRFPAPPHDETGHTWHHDDDLLFNYVKNGGLGNPDMFYPMPAFGDRLSDDDIWATLAYIKTMWTDEQRTTQQERTEVIRAQDKP